MHFGKNYTFVNPANSVIPAQAGIHLDLLSCGWSPTQGGLLKNSPYHTSPSDMSLQRMLESILTLCKTGLDASLRWHDRLKKSITSPFLSKPKGTGVTSLGMQCDFVGLSTGTTI